MKTIVIKNLSTIHDAIAVMIVHEAEESLRSPLYKTLFRDSAKRFGVDVKIKEDAADGKTEYTITDREEKE